MQTINSKLLSQYVFYINILNSGNASIFLSTFHVMLFSEPENAEFYCTLYT